MNSLTAFLSSLTRRSPALIFGCAAVGLLGGLVGAMIHYSRQKPVYESRAFLYPVDATPEKPAIAWMEAEAEAMLRRSTLEAVARRLNLAFERRTSADECTDYLEKSVTVIIGTMDNQHMMRPRQAIADPNATGFSVLRVAMQGDDPAECAAVVGALISEREDSWLTEQRLRLADKPADETFLPEGTNSEELQLKQDKLRAELVAALPAVGVRETNISDAKLSSLQLPALLQPLQAEWNQARQTWERSVPPPPSRPMPLKPYAEVLVRPKAALHPIGPKWAPYGWPWMAGGLVVGLIAGLVFRKFKAYKVEDIPATRLPPASAAEF